ncbi:hypothetical protein [Pandoraea pnomenusa]|uniref:hypothetical protein n=1 Tax=Pandoraea pnomenusa TaxID=93220 RepID=UPI003340ADA5
MKVFIEYDSDDLLTPIALYSSAPPEDGHPHVVAIDISDPRYAEFLQNRLDSFSQSIWPVPMQE